MTSGVVVAIAGGGARGTVCQIGAAVVRATLIGTACVMRSARRAPSRSGFSPGIGGRSGRTALIGMVSGISSQGGLAGLEIRRWKRHL